ncbi:uncharacterized protein LOC111088269 [Limulus polyphemus]|uniref:Uncharacterized protein LOC111088269 n=1 Tax=Limulus polyphemus TaxID=6850 RepID=A0ABM1TCJ1_LIMPO|nr:uncharacterized protein LOC111088269 [Limulus polyphemus]
MQPKIQSQAELPMAAYRRKTHSINMNEDSIPAADVLPLIMENREATAKQSQFYLAFRLLAFAAKVCGLLPLGDVLTYDVNSLYFLWNSFSFLYSCSVVVCHFILGSIHIYLNAHFMFYTDQQSALVTSVLTSVQYILPFLSSLTMISATSQFPRYCQKWLKVERRVGLHVHAVSLHRYAINLLFCPLMFFTVPLVLRSVADGLSWSFWKVLLFFANLYTITAIFIPFCVLLFLCLALRLSFNKFTEILDTTLLASKEDISTEVEGLRRDHAFLCNLARETDAMFSTLVFVAVPSVLCCFVGQLCFAPQSPEKSILHLTAEVFEIVLVVIFCLALVLAADDVTKLSTDCLPCLHKVRTLNVCPNSKFEIQLLTLEVQESSVKFSGQRFFYLHRELLTKVAVFGFMMILVKSGVFNCLITGNSSLTTRLAATNKPITEQ